MNTDLLREDERKWYLGDSITVDLIKLLRSRLCEARAGKYTFAAEQLEAAAKSFFMGEPLDEADISHWLQQRAAELRAQGERK